MSLLVSAASFFENCFFAPASMPCAKLDIPLSTGLSVLSGSAVMVLSSFLVSVSFFLDGLSSSLNIMSSKISPGDLPLSSFSSFTSGCWSLTSGCIFSGPIKLSLNSTNESGNKASRPSSLNSSFFCLNILPKSSIMPPKFIFLSGSFIVSVGIGGSLPPPAGTPAAYSPIPVDIASASSGCVCAIFSASANTSGSFSDLPLNKF